MKKPKKLKRDLSRLGSYLKKETARLEKLIAHVTESDGSPLSIEIWRRLQDRQSAALADLDAVRAAEAAAKLAKSKLAKRKSTKKAPGSEPSSTTQSARQEPTSDASKQPPMRARRKTPSRRAPRKTGDAS